MRRPIKSARPAKTAAAKKPEKAVAKPPLSTGRRKSVATLTKSPPASLRAPAQRRLVVGITGASG